MQYTQKYCLVAFTNPVEVDTEFNVSDWPLHVTLADVFAADRINTGIEKKLNELLNTIPPFTVAAKEEAILGTAQVVLLEKSKDIVTLHTRLIDLLELNDTTFDTPEFTREGFLPHCTIQKTERLQVGDKVNIDTVYLVDMFPNSNWQQRKVLSVFKLQGNWL